MSDDKAKWYEFLGQASSIDFAEAKLDYEGFRHLAKNPNLTPDERLAFGPCHRRGYEDVIIEDITAKLWSLRETGKTVVDIGCGMGSLADRFAALCGRQRHRLIMIDSKEMLSNAPDGNHITKIAGKYPENQDAVQAACPEGADIILCYSVMQYVFMESNVFEFVDSIARLLNNGGAALVGDIPNQSKRRRFFSSPRGIAFHMNHTRTAEPPTVSQFETDRPSIDDSVLAAMVARAQSNGCDCYLMPLDSRLPMANRRDDIIIMKP